MSDLITNDKSSVVSAVNELVGSKVTKENSFTVEGNSSATKSISNEVGLLVGAYGSRGFLYTIHKNGGVYEIKGYSGIAVSMSGANITVANTTTYTFRCRILGM